MILNDSEPCTTMHFQSSSPPPHQKKKKKVTSTIVNNILGEEEKTLNYGHRINELKHKIKMFYIHRAIFHIGVKQKFLVDVYTRT